MFTSLLRAELQEAVFDLADAGGSNFSGANLTKSRWRGSRVFGVEIYNALNQRTGKTVFPRLTVPVLPVPDLPAPASGATVLTASPSPAPTLSAPDCATVLGRTEGHNVGLPSPMPHSYAVFRFTKKRI